MEGDDPTHCDWCEGFGQHQMNCLYQDIDLDDAPATLQCPKCKGVSSPCPCKPVGTGHSICRPCEESHHTNEQYLKLPSHATRDNSPRDQEHWGSAGQSRDPKIKIETKEVNINDIDPFISRKENRREMVDSRRSDNDNGVTNTNSSIKSLSTEINRRVGQVHRRFAEFGRLSRVLARRLDNVDVHLGDIQESLDEFSATHSTIKHVSSSDIGLPSATDKVFQRLHEKRLIGMEKRLKQRLTKRLERQIAKHNKTEKESRARSNNQEKHMLQEMDKLQKKISSLEDLTNSTQHENEMRNKILLAMVPQVIMMKSVVTGLQKEFSEVVNAKERRGVVSACRSVGKEVMRTGVDIQQP